jgi:hypothetical protein
LISGIVFIVTLLVIEMSETALDVLPMLCRITTMGMAKKNPYSSPYYRKKQRKLQ